MEKQRWTTSLRRVEIEICTRCNLSCPNCDRSSPQAPSGELMTIAQLRRFVDESIACDWRWERITLLGGEPTLHPDFAEVLGAVERYRRASPRTVFRMYSNGYGSRVQEVLARMPPWLEVMNTRKTREPPLFSAYNVAPLDLAEYEGEDFTKGCAITTWCGLGLTRYGYYPCGAGASLDRVFGFDIGIKRLIDVTPARLKEQLKQLCARCGHYRDFDQKVEFVKFGDKSALRDWTKEARISPTWADAYERYREERPKLSLY
jgi:hypothetical protein